MSEQETHDDQCESEFIIPAGGWTRCGCASRSEQEASLVFAAERHEPDSTRGGCTCGFCAWSVEHVVRMAWREVTR